MIKILIVDDSETETALLKHLYESDGRMKVIGSAKNGKEAVAMAASLKPDLITMDIQMPIMNGIEAIRLIMSENPTPIVVISSILKNEALKTTFQALEAGALCALDKPVHVMSPEFESTRLRMLQTLRAMAEIKVIKRRFQVKKSMKKIISTVKQKGPYEIIAIGASIGGPQALMAILSKLDKQFPLPIVIVQHMIPGFMSGFTEWLNNNLALTVKNPLDNEALQAGTVYLAPDQVHLTVERVNNQLVAKLIKGKPVSGFCPSVSMLLSSLAKTCQNRAVGVLLTGMGQDGAQGLLEMKQANAHTFIQDQQSAVVFGMGSVAQSLGAVDEVVELDQIADYLIDLSSANSNFS